MFPLPPALTGLLARAIAVLLVVGSIAGYIWYQNHQISEAKEETQLAIAQRDKAASELDAAIAVARTNDQTIKQLQQEKKDVETALANLKARAQRDQKFIDHLTGIIEGYQKDPASLVQLSPVLRDVVNSIQLDRANRQGAQPAQGAKK